VRVCVVCLCEVILTELSNDLSDSSDVQQHGAENAAAFAGDAAALASIVGQVHMHLL
jgi:hypothetical protein